MIIQTRQQFDEMLGELKAAKLLGVDTETDGLNPFKGNRLCGVGVGTAHDRIWYAPFRHEGEFYEGGDLSNLPLEWLAELTAVLSEAPALLGYNIKFDLKMLAMDGYWPREGQKLVDGLVMARLCVPERHPLGGLKLETMAERFLGRGEGAYNVGLEEWMKENKLFIKSKKIKWYHHVPIDRLGAYCIRDVNRLFRTKTVFQRVIMDTDQAGIWEEEVHTTFVLFEMEWRGLEVDIEYCEQAIAQITERLEQLKAELVRLTGQEFNIKSNKQKTEAMNAIGVYSPVVNKDTGNQSWGKEVLELMGANAHPAIALMREYEQLVSLKNTFFEVFLEAGTLHASFQNWGAITGRCSCAGPNLQNIPRDVRGLSDDEEEIEKHEAELAKAISGVLGLDVKLVGKTYEADDFDSSSPYMMAARRAFVPRKEYVYLCFDYSQMEMLVFLCYVNNKSLLKQVEDSYASGEPFDYHTLVATEVWGGPDHPNFKEHRRWAKALNFGLIFGIGKVKLGKNLSTKEEIRDGVVVTEAKTVDSDGALMYKEEYFSRIQGAREFIKRAGDTAEQRGFLINRFRRRYVIDPNRSYVGVNYLVQGSCADFMKQRMWLVREAVKDLDAHMVLQVHDELILEVREDLVDEVVGLVKPIMEERVFQIVLPVEVAECRESWITKEKVAA